MSKSGKVDMSNVKKFLEEGDKNRDGKIQKEEMKQIILKTIKVVPNPQVKHWVKARIHKKSFDFKCCGFIRPLFLVPHKNFVINWKKFFKHRKFDGGKISLHFINFKNDVKKIKGLIRKRRPKNKTYWFKIYSI